MGLNLKKMREAYERKAENKGGIDRWKPEKGDNTVRVLPHTLKYFTDEDVVTIAFTYFSHFGVGPEGAKDMIVCPRTLNTKEHKNRCPVCEAVATLGKTGDPTDQALANDMGMRRRYLMNIIDLKSPETIAKGIQVLECGPTIHDEIFKWCNEKWGDPIALEDGRNMTITKTLPASGDVKRTSYSVEPDPDKTSIEGKLPANWKDQIRKLETMIPAVKTYDEIKRILEGDVEYGEQGTGGKVAAAPAAPAPVQAPALAAKEAEKPSPDKGPGAPPPPAQDGMKPECFGMRYSMKADRCKSCPANAGDSCKKAFLSQ
jgi:hypothetical protein